MLFNSLAAAERQQQGLIEAAWIFQIDIFESGLLLKAGLPQAGLETPLVAVGLLAVDEKSQAFVEAQRLAVGEVELIGKRLDHSGEA